MLKIRNANPHDLATLARLYYGAVMAAAPAHYSEAQVQRWAGFAEEESFREFVLGNDTCLAEDRSGVVGFCSVGAEGHIAALYVRGDCQRRGIGTELLNYAMARAQQQGMRRFHAEASEFSLPLLKKLGFSQVGVERVQRGEVEFLRYLLELELP